MNDRLKQAWDSRVAFWIAAIFIVAIVIAAIVIVVGGDDDTGPETKPSPSASASADGTAPADPLDGEFVTLPAPTSNTDGYPTHYPQTPEGAAATVLAYATASAETLEYSTEAKVLGAYLKGLPSGMTVESLADSSVSAVRQELGFDLSGSAPAGAAADVSIDGVKWRGGENGEVIVSGQAITTYTLPGGETKTWKQAGVLGAAVWSDGRWWIDGTAEVAGTEGAEYAKPGSNAYVQGGWKVIKNTDWTGGLL